MIKRELSAPRAASTARAVLVAVLAPAAATLLALWLQRTGPVTAAAVYLLAVVLAAAAGRLWSGLVAALLSFLGLNFFFTPPTHTLRVETSEDILALLVFLAVSAIVGLLVSRALEEAERARRKEHESAVANALTNGLLSGRPIEQVLEEFARGTVDSFDLAACELHVDTEAGHLDVGATARVSDGAEGEGVRLEIPLSAGSTNFGTLNLVREPGRAVFSEGEKILFAGFARQVLLGLERLRLDAAVRSARLDSESNELRAALFSSVTHDLRTPLASIKAAVSSLLDESVDYDREQKRDLLETVLEETDRLNRLVGNILDLARMRAGVLVPARESTHIEDVIESVLVRMQSKLEGVKVRTLFRPDLTSLDIDPVQIDQVVTNLLENAVRFSPPGGEISITAGRWRSAVQVRITDQGPGIHESERERVFEAFYRSGAEREGGGTGLGLSISQAIIAVHGGRIWIEGAPGGGTAVVFELPSKAESGDA